jgi:aminoglycoside phosphotransferase family enzyme
MIALPRQHKLCAQEHRDEPAAEPQTMPRKLDKMTPGIEEKVAFLSRPQAYAEDIRSVEIRQTHMSWVFLTDKHAWKLKKPARTEYLDFSTPEARRRNCLREVRLNRRLAEGVYLGVVPLTMDRRGNLQLHGYGKTIDWLVQMRRLPGDRMLDKLIASHEVSEQDVLRLASKVVTFYKKARPVLMTGSQYCNRLIDDLERAQRELTQTAYGLKTDLAQSVIRTQLEFLGTNSNLIEARVREGRVIDAHGDLRPEHVCLEAEPVIIDCLEFNRSLRILDAASELAFLALECERLGGPEIGKQLLNVYSQLADDWFPNALLGFYRAYHAVVRAKIAIWHLKDEPVLDPAHWVAKAERYLTTAAHITRAA